MSQGPQSLINPFAHPEVVAGYEDWYQGGGRRADLLEKALLKRLLALFPDAVTLLEIGSGTGHFSRWFGDQGLSVVGVDRSLPMLTEAVHLDGPPWVRGDALSLPFPALSVDLVAMITTLEFLPNPTRALSEAMRVCRQGLLLGVLNRQSLLARQLQKKGGPVWGVANFYAVDELIGLARSAASGRPLEVSWQTTLWPLWPGPLPLPWGGFIGMTIRLVKTGGEEL